MIRYDSTAVPNEDHNYNIHFYVGGRNADVIAKELSTGVTRVSTRLFDDPLLERCAGEYNTKDFKGFDSKEGVALANAIETGYYWGRLDGLEEARFADKKKSDEKDALKKIKDWLNKTPGVDI